MKKKMLFFTERNEVLRNAFIAVCFVVGSIAFVSCTNNEDSSMVTSEITAADIFVASEKYQSYAKMVKEDRKMVCNALKTLTKAEKERFLHRCRV